jgi:hypothetical protein
MLLGLESAALKPGILTIAFEGRLLRVDVAAKGAVGFGEAVARSPKEFTEKAQRDAAARPRDSHAHRDRGIGRADFAGEEAVSARNRENYSPVDTPESKAGQGFQASAATDC